MIVGKNKKIKEKKLNKNNIIIADSVMKKSFESPVIIFSSPDAELAIGISKEACNLMLRLTKGLNFKKIKN